MTKNVEDFVFTFLIVVYLCYIAGSLRCIYSHKSKFNLNFRHHYFASIWNLIQY